MVHSHLVNHKVGHACRFAFPLNVTGTASDVADIAAGRRYAFDTRLVLQFSANSVKPPQKVPLVEEEYVLFIVSKLFFTDILKLSANDDRRDNQYNRTAELHHDQCPAETVVLADARQDTFQRLRWLERGEHQSRVNACEQYYGDECAAEQQPDAGIDQAEDHFLSR